MNISGVVYPYPIIKIKKEQMELRNLYLKGIRAQVADVLESSGLKPGKKHNGACECEHCASVKGQDKEKDNDPVTESGPYRLLH
jgi:hypothetical protein